MPSGTQQERDGQQVPDEVFENFGSGPPTAEEQQRAENEKKKLLGLVNFTPYESNPQVDPAPGEEEEFRRFVSEPPTREERDAAIEKKKELLRRHSVNHPPQESNSEDAAVDETEPAEYTGRHGGPVGDADEIIEKRIMAHVRRMPREKLPALEKLIEDLEAAEEETTTRHAKEPPRRVHLIDVPREEAETDPRIEGAATETAEPEKPHWKDVRRPGEELGDFIKREFAPELAAGTMTRPMLNRFGGLYQDFDNWRRRYPMEVPLELRRLPKKSEANDRLVAEGKVTPEETFRVANRDRKRIAAAAHR
jgi:hypothetical protein